MTCTTVHFDDSCREIRCGNEATWLVDGGPACDECREALLAVEYEAADFVPIAWEEEGILS